jgi:hypothetical protein
MRKIIEEAFSYDYNSMIEEFDFYGRMNPRDQTSLVKNLFGTFKKKHNLFFKGCNKHFINQIITGMYARFYPNYKDVIKMGKLVLEIFFIQRGTVVIR